MQGYQQAHRVHEPKDKRMRDTKIQASTHEREDMRIFFSFFFFYSLFKVDIQNYVIVISLVTIY